VFRFVASRYDVNIAEENLRVYAKMLLSDLDQLTMYSLRHRYTDPPFLSFLQHRNLYSSRFFVCHVFTFSLYCW